MIMNASAPACNSPGAGGVYFAVKHAAKGATRMRGRKIANLLLVVTLMAGGCGVAAPTPASPSQTQPPSPSDLPSTTPTPSAPISPSPSASPSSSPSIDAIIAAEVQSMSLEEKIGQMLMAGVTGRTADKEAKRMIAEAHVGGVILFRDNLSGGPRAAAELLNGLKAANQGNPVPLFFSVDQEGGRVSRLPKEFEPMPPAAVVGRTGEARLAEQMGVLIARELKLLGFNVNFAPVLDVNSNPQNPVIGDRSFGDNPALVSEMGTAVMKGLQHERIIPVVKHFPGHGDTSVDSHLDLPVIHKSLEELEALELVPFRAAVESGADAVMIAHILFPELDPDAPASLSGKIIGGLLRDKLGFDGVVITDDLTMGAVTETYSVEEAAIRSVEAGSDIVLVAHGYDSVHRTFEALADSVRSGRLAESRIDESVKRILMLKRTYRLTDNPVPLPERADIPNGEIRRWLEVLNASDE